MSTRDRTPHRSRAKLAPGESGNPARRASPKASARARGRAVRPGRRQPGEQVYRFTDRALGWMTFGIIALMVVLIGIAVMVAFALDGDDSQAAMRLQLGVTVAAFGLPLALAAVLGGIALTSWGWIPGAVTGAGMWLIFSVAGNSAVKAYADGDPVDLLLFSVPWHGGVLGFVSLGLLVVGIVLYFRAGFQRGVPMWIGTSPVGGKTVSTGILDGESAPGVLAPEPAKAGAKGDGFERGSGGEQKRVGRRPRS